MRRFVFASFLLTAAACGPGFNPFRRIEKPRVIGAQIDVTTDVGRVTPAPGESATLSLVVADAGPKTGRTYTLVACLPGSSNLDIVFCDGSTMVVGLASVTTLPGATDPKPDPSITFDVPDETTLGTAKEIWVVGAVCNGGVVRDLLADPPKYGQPYDPCMPDPNASPAPVGQLITTRITLERTSTDLNHRPTFQTMTLDDPATGTPTSWTAVAPDDGPSTGCKGQGYPELPAFVRDPNDPLAGTFGFSATAMPNDREMYLDTQIGQQVTEDIFVRFFYTAGGFGPTYGTIDDTSPSADTRYTPPPPSEVDDTGTLVRIWIEMIDDRGAATWERRAVCVVR